MALVRKTDKIALEINQSIDALETNKARNLFKSLDIQESLKHFFETAFYNGVFFPEHCLESLKVLANPEIQNIFQVEVPTAKFSLVGQDNNGNIDNIWECAFNLPKEFVLPIGLGQKPMFASYVPNKLGIYFSGILGSCNHFSIVMLMPHIMRGGTVRENPETIPLIGSGFCGNEREMIKNTARILQIGDLPTPVQTAWDDLMNRRDNIWEVMEKFERTRDYIFDNLWQFPSVNKMIEFFPNLKGLLSDKTVSRYMKGTSRKKAEYGVVAPTADIIGATVEANMTGIIDDD